MGLLGDFTGGTSYNGSQNSSWSAGNSQSFQYGGAASATALDMMREANAFTEHMWERTAQYNAEQAQIQRDWEQAQVDIANEMANTTYSRSVKDMITAGINPILAAGAGLGGVGNGSVAGSTSASIGTPAGHMASATPDVISSSQNASEGQGSSWGQSESGLAVGLQMLGQAIGAAISNLNSGNTINTYMAGIGEKAQTTWNDIEKIMVENLPQGVVDALGLSYTSHNSPTERNQNESFSHKREVSGSTTVSGHSTPQQSGHTGGGSGF